MKGWKGTGTAGVVNPDTYKFERFGNADEYRRYVEGGGKGAEGERAAPQPRQPEPAHGPATSFERDADELRKAVADAQKAASSAIAETVREAVRGIARVTEERAKEPSGIDRIRAADRGRRLDPDTYGLLPPTARPGERVTEITDRYGVHPADGSRPEPGMTPRPTPSPSVQPLVARAAEFLKGSYHLDTLSGRSSGAAPAGGEALGGSFVGLAGRATAAAAVLGKLWESGNKLVEEQEQAARKIAQFSPSIAAAVGQLDAQRAMRALQTGEKTAATTSAMTAAINRKEQAQQPIDILVTNLKNTAATAWLNFQTKLFDALGPMAEAANRSLGMDDKSDTATWSGLLPELAAERGVTQRAAEGRMRFVNDIMNGR